MNYINMFSAIIKELNRDKELSASYSYNTEMARAVELWSRMYRGKAPWNNDRTPCAGLAASIAAETAKLVTIELILNAITNYTYLSEYFAHNCVVVVTIQQVCFPPPPCYVQNLLDIYCAICNGV